MTKLLKKSLFAITFIATSNMAFADNPLGEKTYKENCSVCHSKGVAGAPIVGNAKAWAPRIAKGAEALYKSAIGGIGNMPPKGGASQLTDDQVKAVVDYMISKGS